MHLAYIWIVSHLSAKNYRNWWKFDEVLTKTNLLSFFLGHGVGYGVAIYRIFASSLQRVDPHAKARATRASRNWVSESSVSDADNTQQRERVQAIEIYNLLAVTGSN